MNCYEPRRDLVKLLNPDRQDSHLADGALQFTRDSVLPTELDVFDSLHLARDGDTAELRNEDLNCGLSEARRSEHASLETAHRMRGGEQVATDLQVVDLNSIGSRECQDPQQW